eukprot:TRINITY_DN27671_c0_g1_i1.p1 TRINITY_DN27671_c0_g1~~TRINITY_DN27671_c0_g1_i1.p1  ORF type:complete len:615 (+),score=92.11 TRINITY_DN27671_c0_g1_i1:98-1942(+)
MPASHGALRMPAHQQAFDLIVVVLLLFIFYPLTAHSIVAAGDEGAAEACIDDALLLLDPLYRTASGPPRSSECTADAGGFEFEGDSRVSYQMRRRAKEHALLQRGSSLVSQQLRQQLAVDEETHAESLQRAKAAVNESANETQTVIAADYSEAQRYAADDSAESEHLMVDGGNIHPSSLTKRAPQAASTPQSYTPTGHDTENEIAEHSGDGDAIQSGEKVIDAIHTVSSTSSSSTSSPRSEQSGTSRSGSAPRGTAVPTKAPHGEEWSVTPAEQHRPHSGSRTPAMSLMQESITLHTFVGAHAIGPLLVVCALLVMLLCAGGLLVFWVSTSSETGGPRQQPGPMMASDEKHISADAPVPSPVAAVRQQSFSGMGRTDSFVRGRGGEGMVSPVISPLMAEPRTPHRPGVPPRMPVPEGPQQAGCLCPSLVVPHGLEFVFAVPEVLTRSRQQLSTNVVDVTGQPLCRMHVTETGGGRRAIALQLLDDTPLAEISTEPLYDHPRGLPCIQRPSGEVFCQLVLDQMDASPHSSQRRYHLQGADGKCHMSFQGDFAGKAMNGVLPSGMLACSTRRCNAPLKASGHASFYEVRVAPFVDAGLVLSGLLAVEKAEACCVRA